jgi:hypothetical protein
MRYFFTSVFSTCYTAQDASDDMDDYITNGGQLDDLGAYEGEVETAIEPVEED